MASQKQALSYVNSPGGRTKMIDGTLCPEPSTLREDRSDLVGGDVYRASTYSSSELGAQRLAKQAALGQAGDTSASVPPPRAKPKPKPAPAYSLPPKMRAKVKTELCVFWTRPGGCQRGARCAFAHGEHELRRTHEAAAKHAASASVKLQPPSVSAERPIPVVAPQECDWEEPIANEADAAESSMSAQLLEAQPLPSLDVLSLFATSSEASPDSVLRPATFADLPWATRVEAPLCEESPEAEAGWQPFGCAEDVGLAPLPVPVPLPPSYRLPEVFWRALATESVPW